MRHDPIGVGIVGNGTIAEYYFAAFASVPGLELRGVCDLRPERLVAHRDRGMFVCESYKELADNPAIDAIVLTAPNDVHYEVCAHALAAGKSVCCEKPLVPTANQARDLIDLARVSQAVLFTSYHRRYNRNVLQGLAGVDSERIVGVEASYLERIEDHAGVDRWYLDPVRCGGGCIADNGPNVFDTLALFMGRLSVESVDIVHDARGVDRQARVVLREDRGTPAVVNLDWDYPLGEKKTLSILVEHARGRRNRVDIDMLAGFSEFKGSLWHEYAAVLGDFMRAIRAREFDSAGIDAVRLVEEAYQKGREP